jgi:hypothetical protein
VPINQIILFEDLFNKICQLTLSSRVTKWGAESHLETFHNSIGANNSEKTLKWPEVSAVRSTWFNLLF